MRPHAPQLATVLNGDSQPLSAIRSQSPKPALQVNPQVAAAQKIAAFGRTTQPFPHSPQWLTLVWRLASHPSIRFALQSPKPASHAINWHIDETHAVEAFARAQSTPHAPQWLFALRVSTSQPFRCTRSQSPKPTTHDENPHAPATHVGAALLGAHVALHAPQWLSDVRVSTSQPLAAIRSQSAKPGLHAPTVQIPPTQRPVPLAAVQRDPQAPQCCASVIVFVSQPLKGSPSQSPKPKEQDTARHRALSQRDVIALAAAQGRLHAPQCAGLLCRSTQSIPQRTAGLVQPEVQPTATPPHTGVAPAHASPQRAQWALEPRGLSHPSAPRPLQSPKPGSHERTTHVPRSHAVVPFAPAQVIPQPPQWLLSACVSTQRPPHICCPAGHPVAHVRVVASHAGVAPVQRTPHAPQCSAEPSEASQPLLGSPSQSAKPSTHRSMAHRERSQRVTAFARAQRLSHAPQCSTSVWIDTHCAPH